MDRNNALKKAALKNTALLVAGWGLCLACLAQPKPPELPAETLEPSTLEGRSPNRVYVADIAISHIADGRIRIFDAVNGRFLGMVSTGFAGNFAVNPAAQELYVATTYLSRSYRGERIDVLEVHDTTSLGFKYEVQLPPQRAQALNYRGLVSLTANGRFVLVQNATPGTSITVVDLQNRRVASQIDTPGCWGSLPASSHPARFSMLCGDGKVATVTLDEDGQLADRGVTDKVFDPDGDAWFHHAEQIGDRFFFLSFQGVLTEMNLGGATGQVVRQKGLVDAASRKAGWRPGGYQNFAVHPNGRWLVAAMHAKGAEGSHKFPAEKLWVVDMATGQRVATHPGSGAVSLTFSRQGERLQALDGLTGAMQVWRFASPQRWLKQTRVVKAGEAALHLESHD
ncbi:amine dehydrogenase large subunit [Limnohabitans sp.]|jgi:methylamine dehydrogenase heavy chain|uniref:amine dehydrogenase large subunit n=1 Tax=Limnohabitans sp. TaxID=1907725 RepID=UPI0037BF48A4